MQLKKTGKTLLYCTHIDSIIKVKEYFKSVEVFNTLTNLESLTKYNLLCDRVIIIVTIDDYFNTRNFCSLIETIDVVNHASIVILNTVGFSKLQSLIPMKTVLHLIRNKDYDCHLNNLEDFLVNYND